MFIIIILLKACIGSVRTLSKEPHIISNNNITLAAFRTQSFKNLCCNYKLCKKKNTAILFQNKNIIYLIGVYG